MIRTWSVTRNPWPAIHPPALQLTTYSMQLTTCNEQLTTPCRSMMACLFTLLSSSASGVIPLSSHLLHHAFVISIIEALISHASSVHYSARVSIVCLQTMEKRACFKCWSQSPIVGGQRKWLAWTRDSWPAGASLSVLAYLCVSSAHPAYSTVSTVSTTIHHRSINDPSNLPSYCVKIEGTLYIVNCTWYIV